MPYLNKEERQKLIEAKLNKLNEETSINTTSINKEKKVKFKLGDKEYVGTYVGDSSINPEWADIYVGPEYYDNNESMFNRTPIYNPHEDRNIVDGKFFIPKSELTEEVLTTKKEVKYFEVGSKVKIIDGKYKDKTVIVKYCDGGKCVIQLGSEQLFVDANTLEACNDKPLSEDYLAEEDNVEDDIVVKVDGEVIADTSTEEVESGEQPVNETPIIDEVGTKATEPSATLGIVDLLIRAVQDEYETISFYNSLIGMANESNLTDIATVVNHINEEENIHVGMLQHIITELSEQAKQVEVGKEEAQEILSDEELEAIEDFEQEPVSVE